MAFEYAEEPELVRLAAIEIREGDSIQLDDLHCYPVRRITVVAGENRGVRIRFHFLEFAAPLEVRGNHLLSVERAARKSAPPGR
jgi:hypothetical protein